MQIIPQDDCLVIVSEDPTETEENKVRAFKWTDIKTITFIYPPQNIWQTLKSAGELIGGVYAGVNGASLVSKTINIDIELKDGNKTSNEFRTYSIEQGKELEQLLLKHLNSADTKA